MPCKEIGIGCSEDTSIIIFGGYILAEILAALFYTDTYTIIHSINGSPLQSEQ